MLSDVQNILNRDDCSTSLAQTFLNQGIARIQRDCRLPSMERAQLITPASTPLTELLVPIDLIQVIDLIVPVAGDTDGRARGLKRVAYRKLLEYGQSDLPKVFARSQGTFYVRGAVPIGTQIQLLYYGNFSAFANADSENELSASTPDLAVYAALSYAGDHFEHPMTDKWEGRYQQIKAEVMAMAIDLDTEGGVQVVEPIYQTHDWD